jgi:hypothetical protein
MKNSNATMYGYSLTSSSSWSIFISQFNYGSTAFINSAIALSNNNTNEITSAQFLLESDSITVPPKSFVALSSNLTQAGFVLAAATNTFSYNGLCSDKSSNLQNIALSFGDGVTYVVPPQSYIMDDPV